MAFCRTCGGIIPRPMKANKLYCSLACGNRARNRDRIGYKKPWKYCGACGHTEEMHRDLEGHRNCMEPAGPPDSKDPVCGCLWVEVTKPQEAI